LELYDTHQMVKGFPLPQTERESDKFFEILEDIHDRARGKKKKQTIILDKNDGINVKEGAM
ncbi:ATPase, partial [Bacillus cereus]